MQKSPVIFGKKVTQNDLLIGIITLNAPKSLNPLSLEMIELIYPVLIQWQHDSNVVCVFLQGSGEKAFCAGGDLRELYNSIIKNPKSENEYANNFFAKEYRLDYLIHTYPKPIICWAHGIVMGGGLGLMIGASHRIVTQKSKIAMPEISIGLYPDVGGSYFLSRISHHIGLYLALTGSAINAADAICINFADYFIQSESKELILEKMINSMWSNNNDTNFNIINKILQDFEIKDQLPDSKLEQHAEFIQNITSYPSLSEIVNNIASIVSNDKWIQDGVENLKKGSPTTAHLIYEQIKRGKILSLKQCFMMEFVLSIQCTRHPDFPEGIRALLIDRDNNPSWYYKCVDLVPEQWILEHFQNPCKNGINPLSDL